MDVREKLVELFFDAQQIISVPYGMETEKATRCIFEQMADHLIAHGATAQEWISVKDRLPTVEDALTDGSVYAYTKAKKVLVLHYQYVCRRSDYILCWMPIAMPQPPKEVKQ